MRTFIIDLPGVAVDNPALPILQSYAEEFESIPGLIAWWDFTDVSARTVVGGALAALSASAGSGRLSQANPAFRPPVSGDDVTFSAHALTYEGLHPTGSHSVAAIVEGVTPLANQIIAGYGRLGGTLTADRHVLAVGPEAGGIVTYSAGVGRYANRSLPSALGPYDFFGIGEYDGATGNTLLEINGAAQHYVGGDGTGAKSTTMNVGAGAVTASLLQPLSGIVRDVWLFDSRIITAGTQAALRAYARDVRGISV